MTSSLLYHQRCDDAISPPRSLLVSSNRGRKQKKERGKGGRRCKAHHAFVRHQFSITSSSDVLWHQCGRPAFPLPPGLCLLQQNNKNKTNKQTRSNRVTRRKEFFKINKKKYKTKINLLFLFSIYSEMWLLLVVLYPQYQ